MTSVSSALLLSIMLTLVTIQMVVALRNLKKSVYRSFVVIAVAMFWWLACAILHYIWPDAERATWFFLLEYIAIGIVPVGLLVFILDFYKLHNLLSRATRATIWVVPALTVVLTLSNGFHGLLFQALQLTEVFGLRVMTYTYGPWFFLHTGYSYLAMGLSFFVVLSQYRKVAKIYRWPSRIIICGLAVSVAVNLPVILKVSNLVDLTPVGSAVALTTLLWAMTNNRDQDYITLARHEVFNTMNELTFILSRDRKIMDANAAAKSQMESICPVLHGQGFDALLEQWMRANNGQYVSDALNERLIALGDGGRVFSVYERNMLDADGHPIGNYIQLTDVTKVRALIQKLEYEAGVDPLTGLSNRRIYQQVLGDIDQPDNLPISVILGDIDELKQMNDRYGHEYGDRLICDVAEVISQHAPEYATLARIGGDEFALLLPNTSGAQAQNLMDNIESACLERERAPIRPSISMGCATKENTHQDLKILVNEADKRLYKQKFDKQRQNK